MARFNIATLLSSQKKAKYFMLFRVNIVKKKKEQRKTKFGIGSLALLLPKGNDFDRVTMGVKISVILTSWTAKDNIILTCKELLHSALDALSIKDFLSQKRNLWHNI